MTARELDPAVWAAAYGTTYAQQAEAVRLAGAEGSAFGINVERCRQVADDAVLSLHPDGFADKHEILDRIARATTHPEALRPPLPLPEAWPVEPVPGASLLGSSLDVWRRVAERVIAEHAAATIGRTCEHGTCEAAPGSGAPRTAVARVDGVNFCERHAPRESDLGLARAVLALLERAG